MSLGNGTGFDGPLGAVEVTREAVGSPVLG